MPLACTYRLAKQLEKNKNKEASGLLYKTLCLLIEETNEEKFNNLLKNCLVKMKETEEFGFYFESEWVNIKTEWAKCYRIGSEINTNMYLEAFHKSLKYGNRYFKGK